ncbi:MAG: Fpg/Nei family DNA glycosylase [Acidimicrobiia bacterium]
MPELPDIVVYIEALERRITGEVLEGVRVTSPSLLRTFDPPLSAVEGTRVEGLERLGKRIVLQMENDLFIVIHLMIAGRLRWETAGKAIPKKVGLAAFDFPDGSLILTEQGSHKRASLHVVSGREQLEALGRGGIEPLEATRDEFAAAVQTENRTLKRALTDPRFLSGIGNAYSDEILHRAQLSPVRRSGQLATDELTQLYEATQEVLTSWTDLLRDEVGDGFPKKVTAFRPEMAVHGRYGEPCPRCGSPVQRIVYAKNETNYCASCQTDGKLLADRSLSRLLKGDWPRTLEELEELQEPS